MGIAEWPQDAPRNLKYEFYDSTTTEDKAKELFMAKHKKYPDITFIWSDWRYAGPIGQQTMD